MGAPGPIALEAMAPDGSWLAYCQATSDTDGDGVVHVGTNQRGELVGDHPAVHLALAGRVEAIDELLAFDETGRWLVARQGETAWLLDTEKQTRLDLTPFKPDLRSDEMFEVGHRSFAFDAQGKHLVILSQLDKLRYEARLFDLAKGDLAKHHVLSLPAGETWRVNLSPDGAVAFVHTILHEPGRAQNLRWPAPFRSEPIRRCHGPLAQAKAFGQRAGQLTTFVTATENPSLQSAPGFVLPFGDGWLRREANGRLMLVRGTTQKQVASERCGARVLHADPLRELFLISCEHYALEAPKENPRSKKKKAPPKFRFELYLVAPGFVKDLQADMAATRMDIQPSASPRLVPLRPGARTVLLDMDRRELLELSVDDRIVATYESKALVRRGQRLLVYDAGTRKERQIASQVAPFPDIRQSGRYVFVEPYVVDLMHGKVRIGHHGTPLAITHTGRLLVPSAPATERDWGQGPLKWLDSSPNP